VKYITLGGLLSASLLCLASSGLASSAPPVPVSMGNNTWSITVEASNAFHRDVDKLKSDATDAANKFCADQGKQMKLISLEGKLPMFSLGYARAKIVFKALSPGDPDLTAPVYAPGAPAPVYAPVAERHLTTDELYNELVKLDDLRKKGILTDDEFQAEKKKLLNRSN
jgi:Short C-terminal domain